MKAKKIIATVLCTLIIMSVLAFFAYAADDTTPATEGEMTLIEIITRILQDVKWAEIGTFFITSFGTLIKLLGRLFAKGQTGEPLIS
ncbi:MAG: hypothetical protein K6B52_00515 [Clostridiales bacterium]|nr:hypothetical protein [Clostridiales bacterium]